MNDADVLAWIAEDVGLLADLCEGRTDTPVPSCPGWTLGHLAGHIGRFLFGWYANNLSHDPARPDPRSALRPAVPVPEIAAERVDYLRASLDFFLETATTADLDALVWVDFPEPGPARYWLSACAVEVSLHTWDAAGAVGEPYELAPARAVHTVDLLLTMLWTRRRQWWISEIPEAPTEPLALTATDTVNHWVVVRGDTARVVVDPREVNVPLTIRGSAMDLALWLYGRVPTSSLDTTGPIDSIEQWNLVPLIERIMAT